MIEVREDGIYESNYQYSRLIISKEILSEAMLKWFGIPPLECEYYKNGHCMNTKDCWAVGCNGKTKDCKYGKWW